MITAKFTGGALFAQKVAHVKRVARGRIAKRLEAEAQKIVTDMQAQVPVQTGGLRDSIRYRALDKDHPAVVILAGGTPATMKQIGDRAVTFDQALGVEFGTSHSAPQPFFWPVIDTYRRNADDGLAVAEADAAAEELD